MSNSGRSSASHPLPPGAPLWIAAPAGLREACFSLPAVRALAASRPVTLLAPETQRILWEQVPDISVVPLSPDPRAELSGCPALLLWEDGPLAKAAVKVHLPRRIGVPQGALRKKLTHPLPYTPAPGPATHHVQRFLGVARLLQAPVPERRFFAPLPAPQMGAPKMTLLIGPESEYGTHYQWPLEFWSQLWERLRPPRQDVAVLASTEATRAWAEAHSLPTCETRDWSRLVSARLLLTVETPALHVAAAYGVKCAVLYGPGDPALTRPLGKQHLAIRRKAECSPCFADHCLMGDLRCQNEMTPEFVATKLRSVMECRA